jgi:hypothetical protein
LHGSATVGHFLTLNRYSRPLPEFAMSESVFSLMRRTNLAPLSWWCVVLRRPRGLVFASVVLFASMSLGADPLTRDVGENLRYVRAHVVPADLPSPVAKPGAVILDLRYTLAEAGAPMALAAWIKSQSAASTPLIVLMNHDTAPALRESLAAHINRSGLITIGRASSDITPDLAIESTSEEERRAYDALENNSSIESLITENAQKPRIDEASIMRARADPDSAEADTDFPEDPTSPEKKMEAAPPPPVDRALQRAIHLHRALLALKRL